MSPASGVARRRGGVAGEARGPLPRLCWSDFASVELLGGFPVAFAAAAKVTSPPGTSELVNKIGI